MHSPSSRFRRLAVLVAAIATSAVLALTPTAGAFTDKDCKDFDSRKQAQKFFKKHDPQDDPHNLDADNDGKACEDYDY